MGRIELIQGDITVEMVDVIVNAANRALRGGGGVDGAIHRAAGPTLLAECLLLGGCEVGEAKATGAGDLRARYVIHTVGPTWRGGNAGEARLLAACHHRCIELAAGLGCVSLAFPALSTGVFGYPVELAAPVALGATRQALAECPQVELVRFVLYDARTYRIFERALLAD